MTKPSMQRAIAFLCVVTGSICLAESHVMAPGPQDPEGTAAHIAYENDTYTPGSRPRHLPGAHLEAPGDTYRFTLIHEDQFSTDPNYEIIRASVGIHIDDYEPGGEDHEDPQPEWGRILINGKALDFRSWNSTIFTAPDSSAFMEIVSDYEVSENPEERLVPPYIFDVADLLRENQYVVIEVTNLREDGTVDGDADFGDFVVNRGGMHVWYRLRD